MDKAAWITLVWLVASAVLNALLSFKSPEAWEAFVVRYPRGAAAVKLVRKLGLDLPGVLRLVAAFVRRKAGAQ